MSIPRTRTNELRALELYHTGPGGANRTSIYVYRDYQVHDLKINRCPIPWDGKSSEDSARLKLGAEIIVPLNSAAIEFLARETFRA
jgi:hypothetical protein